MIIGQYALDWLYYLALLCMLVLGLWVNLIGLPGLWLIVASLAVYAWITGVAEYVSLWTIMAAIVIAGVAEVVEFVAGGAGAKKVGGSTRSVVFAIVGALLGGFILSIPVPVLGTIVGVVLGTFIGAAIAQFTIHQDVEHSVRVGIGAAKGRLVATILKSGFGVVIAILAAISAFPTGRTAVISAPATQPATVPATIPATLEVERS